MHQHPKSKWGGQPGNQNAKKDGEPYSEFLSIRCKKSDKTAWTRAANEAKAAGKLDGALADGRQRALPAWATLILNREAARHQHKSSSG